MMVALYYKTKQYVYILDDICYANISVYELACLNIAFFFGVHYALTCVCCFLSFALLCDHHNCKNICITLLSRVRAY